MVSHVRRGCREEPPRSRCRQPRGITARAAHQRRRRWRERRRQRYLEQRLESLQGTAAARAAAAAFYGCKKIAGGGSTAYGGGGPAAVSRTVMDFMLAGGTWYGCIRIRPSCMIHVRVRRRSRRYGSLYHDDHHLDQRRSISISRSSLLTPVVRELVVVRYCIVLAGPDGWEETACERDCTRSRSGQSCTCRPRVYMAVVIW